jgi:hypothetical protein
MFLIKNDDYIYIKNCSQTSSRTDMARGDW